MSDFMKEYLNIGEISKCVGLPISTLRYYDKEGILHPAYKDENSGYRYYAYYQIPVLKIIKHLKKLGLNNNLIKSYLSDTSHEHTLSLLDKMILETKKEIDRLKNTILELEQSKNDIHTLVLFREKIGKIEIVEEDIEGIVFPINKKGFFNGIKEGIEKIMFYFKNGVEYGLDFGILSVSFNIEKFILENDISIKKFILLKRIENYEFEVIYKKQKFITMTCKSNYFDLKKNLAYLYNYLGKKGYKLDGEGIINIISSSEFDKDPNIALYILKLPIK